MPRRVRTYPELTRLVKYFHSGQTPPQILLLGDSVTERISKQDKDKRSLGDIVAAELDGKYRFACISHSAYQMEIYDALLNTLGVMKHTPELVILPLNMRSFSPQWHLEPSWQFEREIEALRHFVSDPQRTIPVINETPASPAQYEAFDMTEANYPYTSIKMVGHFRLVINAKPQSKAQFDYRKRQIFIFHYLYKLNKDHAKVKYLVRIVRTMLDMNIKLLVYITPVNCQAGDRYVDGAFSGLIGKNVHVIYRALKPFLKAQMQLLDLNNYLASDKFFNNDDPTEHLNQHGRAALASRISAAGMKMMVSKGDRVS